MVKSILISLGAIGLSTLMFLQSWPAAETSSGAGKGDPSRPYSVTSDHFIKDNKILLQSAPPSAAMSNTLRTNAKESLRLAPLSDDAILHLAVADILENNTANAILLLEEAKKLNARNRGVLLTLIQQRSNQGDMKGVLHNIDILYRLESGKRDAYLKMLDGLYQQPEGRKEIKRSLEDKPEWAYLFLTRQIDGFYERFVDIDDLTPLVETYVTQSRDPYFTNQLVQRYLYLLAKLNRINDAYNFWHKLYKSGTNRDNNIIQNGSFTKMEAPPPFNWQLNYSPAGGAEYEEAGLFIFHNSENVQLLAQQYIRIPAAESYSLTSVVSGSLGHKKGRFEWRLNCLGGGALWHVAPIVQANITNNTLTDIIPSPSEPCNFAAVNLYGFPGKYADRFSLQIGMLSITPNANPEP